VRVAIKRLGLAAYVKMNGGKFLGHEDGHFMFDTEKSERDWEVDYVNSCCAKHDSEVMQLRKLMRG